MNEKKIVRKLLAEKLHDSEWIFDKEGLKDLYDSEFEKKRKEMHRLLDKGVLIDFAHIAAIYLKNPDLREFAKDILMTDDTSEEDIEKIKKLVEVKEICSVMIPREYLQDILTIQEYLDDSMGDVRISMFRAVGGDGEEGTILKVESENMVGLVAPKTYSSFKEREELEYRGGGGG